MALPVPVRQPLHRPPDGYAGDTGVNETGGALRTFLATMSSSDVVFAMQSSPISEHVVSR